jgi:hypothetical protein
VPPLLLCFYCTFTALPSLIALCYIGAGVGLASANPDFDALRTAWRNDRGGVGRVRGVGGGA